MTVLELIEQLKQFPGNLTVHLASDPEGNYFHPLFGTQMSQCYDQDDDEFHPVAKSDIGVEYDPRDLTPAVILWP